MVASKCLSHQVTQLFVGKICATFCFILLTTKQFGKSQLWHIFSILIFVQMKKKMHNLVAYSKV
jgi:hypothetical protein